LESWQGQGFPVIRKHARQILKDKVFIWRQPDEPASPPYVGAGLFVVISRVN
jgi:hypothetical protein